MTTDDKTGASEADDPRVETVARALFAAAHPSEDWLTGYPEDMRKYFRRLAAAAIAADPSPAEAVTLRDALRAHHPIMRSETGPFSGCRCGQVRLGQDVIAHVVGHLRAALASPAPARHVSGDGCEAAFGPGVHNLGASPAPAPQSAELPLCNLPICPEGDGDHRITTGRCIVVPAPQGEEGQR